MGPMPEPFIEKVRYSEDFLRELEKTYAGKGSAERDWITHQLRFPTVYIICSELRSDYGVKYVVYVGETNDIAKRTRQHLYQDTKVRGDWLRLRNDPTAQMYVIGHPYFNKSLTLDIENRFLHYLEACQSVGRHNNRRTNEQREYFTLDFLDEVFDLIWDRLMDYERSTNLQIENSPRALFESRESIRKSAIFKASPFHKLNDAQLAAQDAIFRAVNDALEPAGGSDGVQKTDEGPDSHRLIIVEGEAGSGKTVLISSIFNGLMSGVRDEDERYRNLAAGPDGEGTNIDAYLISGHKNEGGQFQVYDEIVKKLGLPASARGSKQQRRVYKPTTFINQFSPDAPADVVLIDEAHLLLTQKAMGYSGEKPQIEAILDRARVVVAVFDEKQVLEAPQVWQNGVESHFREKGRNVEKTLKLGSQLRLQADVRTIDWIRGLADRKEIGPMHPDSRGYDLRIFESPCELEHAIREKDSKVENSLARLIATFDWKYSAARQNPESPDGLWYVDVEHPKGSIHLPWNLQLKAEKERRIAYRSAWSEQPETINEIGSTFTIQGFDLNYAGVILGPSVTYRDGRIVIDPSASAHAKAVRNRTFDDGSKASFGEELIANELNVLLTRGVKGLYIYADDEALRNALLTEQQRMQDSGRDAGSTRI